MKSFIIILSILCLMAVYYPVIFFLNVMISIKYLFVAYFFDTIHMQ